MRELLRFDSFVAHWKTLVLPCSFGKKKFPPPPPLKSWQTYLQHEFSFTARLERKIEGQSDPELSKSSENQRNQEDIGQWFWTAEHCQLSMSGGLCIFRFAMKRKKTSMLLFTVCKLYILCRFWMIQSFFIFHNACLVLGFDQCCVLFL